MADPVNTVVRACDAVCKTDEECMSVLTDAVALVRARLGISDAKAEGGTSGEMWTARRFGLTWEAQSKHGIDAVDSKGRSCEIKASIHPGKTKLSSRINIGYKSPARRTGELDDAFLTRTREKISDNLGGHFWATFTIKSNATGSADASAAHASADGRRVVLSWWVPGIPLAALIAAKTRVSGAFASTSGSVDVNFGAVVCPTCGGVHRIEKTVRALGGWVSRTDSPEDLEAKLARTADTFDVPPDAIIRDLIVTAVLSRCD